MKKLILGAAVLIGAALVAGTGSAVAQSQEAVGVYIQKVNPEKLKAAVAKSDAEIADPAKAAKSATWIKRGNTFIDIDTKPVNGLYVGIAEADLKVSIPGEYTVENVNLSGQPYTLYRGDQAHMYLNADGVLAFYTPSIVVDSMALGKAYEAFDKAYQLDPKAAKKVKTGMQKIHENAKLDAEIFFGYIDNLKLANANFTMAYRASAHPAVAQPDTAALFNAGYAAVLMGDFATAVKDMDEVIAMGYESNGNSYYFKAVSQYQAGEKEAALATMEVGRDKFPANENLISLIMAYYSDEDKDPSELVSTVQAAIERNPENGKLYEGLARIYDVLKKYDDAIATIKKAVELSPADWYPSFLEGSYMINKGNAQTTENNARAMSLSSAENQANKDAVNAIYKAALVPLERAFELAPTNVNVVERLKNLTFVLRDDPDVASKYEKYNELSKKLAQ